MSTLNPMSQAEALQFITTVETKIESGATGQTPPLDPARIWKEVGVDALILFPPTHQGKTADIARQVYHRLLARFIGGEIYNTQITLLNRGLLLALVSHLICLFLAYTLSSSRIGFLSGALILIPSFLIGAYALWIWFTAPELTKSKNLPKIRSEVEDAVKRCFLRVMPKGTPADLSDVWRHGWLTSDHAPISSEIVDTDATSMAAFDVARNWFMCIVALAVLVPFALVPGFFLIVLFLCFVIAPKTLVNPCELRGKELDRQNAVEGSLLVAAGGVHWAEHQEAARFKQIGEAMRDKTPPFVLGESTGILAGRSDFFAPSAGMEFALSLTDIQNHLLILGGTGSGKTSGILRPLAKQIAATERVGLVVMDGKAALPAELKDLLKEDITIIDPAHTKFSLVGGLSPAEIVDTLADILRSGGESDPFWSDSAMGLLRRAAVLAKELGGKWWTLQGIGKLAVSDEARAQAIKLIPYPRVQADPLLQEALFFFADEWNLMDTKPKSSVLAHARSWISVITAHPDLLKWANTLEGEDDFDLSSPLYGGRLGFLIPSHRYGRAGAVVTALLKARLYSGLKDRAERPMKENETPVIFLIDEAQEVATQDDATMLSIGRSLGLGMIAATQTIEGINDTLGESAALKWLAVYGNAIGLSGRSRATDSFIAHRAGSCWRATVNQVPGASVRDTIMADAFSGAIAASRTQPSMREWSGQMEITVQSLVPQNIFFLSQKRQAGAAATVNATTKNISASLYPAPLVHPEEMPSLLAEPNLALAVTTRGRVPRRDVIKLNPIF